MMKNSFKITGTVAVSALLFSCGFHSGDTGNEPPRPNIIVIMSDDMGFSDIGCYGGEVKTPNLDYLAENGIRYSQFYNGARCCPTRASLLTGLYPHQAGMGWMTNANLGTLAYQGDLTKNTPTIAEVLRTAGYATYMTGKWHVSNTRKDVAGITDNWPVQRGFDRYFGIVQGAGNFFRLNVYSNNDRYRSPDNFYFTHALNDSSAMFIEQHARDQADKPFFMYVSHIAPHWPLHALEEDIAKYDGVYEVGWDVLRKERFNRQYEIGLWETDVALSPRDEEVPAWNTLSDAEKREFVRRKAIYAAQIDAMDQSIGHIIDALKKTGQFENTIIIFLNDNGACAEYISGGPSRDLWGDLSETWESYRIHWANVGSTPFREYKHWVHEGGIRTPFIVHWPNGIDKSLNNTFVREYGHLTDIMATCIELAGAKFPKTFNGMDVVPLQGASLVPHFSGKSNNRGPIFWEHQGNIAHRDGDWKLVAKTPVDGEFDPLSLELYNIWEDPAELNNLAAVYPDRLNNMYSEWLAWANEVGVFPIDTRDYGARSRDYKRQINGEFDMDFGDWDIVNPGNRVDFSIDRTSKISGTNSARITINERSQGRSNAALKWIFPHDHFRRFDVSFSVTANRETTLLVVMDHAADPSHTVAKHSYQIDETIREFSFTTDIMDRPGRFSLSFYVGNNPVGDVIWLDAVNLEPVE
jgi:arylsulfatase A-like enzyme